jgi:hypothetical protein
MTDDGAAALDEFGLERIRDALPEGLGVVDDVDALLAEDVDQVLRGSRALDVVRRSDADVVDPLGVRSQLIGAVLGLGETRVRVRRAALEEPSLVRDRDLRLGHARVERSHDGQEVLVGHDRRHVARTRLGVVRAVDGIIEDRGVRDLDRVAASLALGILERELDAVDHRLRGRQLAALERELDGHLVGAASAARVACCEHDSRSCRERTKPNNPHETNSSSDPGRSPQCRPWVAVP